MSDLYVKKKFKPYTYWKMKNLQTDFEKLVLWSKTNYAHLPWRQKEKRDLYEALVAEVMLQQTTVATVLPRYEAFLEQFANVQTLANADEKALALAWQGLGYYRRAQNLKKAALAIVNLYGGEFPTSQEKLLEIPGIGPYTAAALTAIGRDELALAVDGNLQRVLSRYFNLDDTLGVKLQSRLAKLLEVKKFSKALSQNSPRRVNEALMDLGRTVCRPKKPKCDECSLGQGCEARDLGKAESLPRREEKKKVVITELKLVRLIIRNEEGAYLCYQKEKGEWLKDQWELPTLVLECTETELKQYPFLEDKRLSKVSEKQITTAITRYRIRNHFCLLEHDELDKLSDFFKKRKMAYCSWPNSEAHLSTATEKVLNLITQD